MKISKNMKIGIDISQIVYEGTGVSRFKKGLLNAILTYDKRNEWVFFFSSLRRTLQEEIKQSITKKNHRLIQYRIPPKIMTSIWIKIGFNIESIEPTLDWFITSDWAEIPSKSIKKATIVHDLAYLRYPHLVDTNVKRTQTDRLDRVKKESLLIFADSHTTKKDLIDLLDIDKKRIIVNYPGVDVIKSKEQITKKNFILAVGKLEPRKNLERLIKAFSRLNDKSIELVIVGQTGWGESLPPTNNVKFLGYVDDDKLSKLYNTCLLFIYPSIWEGFGYPVVEAMKLGAPVATSNTSSLKEIADSAALFFDPFDVEDIRSKMQKLIDDESLRNTLIKKGRQRSALFTWKKYINKLTQTLYDYRN